MTEDLNNLENMMTTEGRITAMEERFANMTPEEMLGDIRAHRQINIAMEDEMLVQAERELEFFYNFIMERFYNNTLTTEEWSNALEELSAIISENERLRERVMAHRQEIEAQIQGLEERIARNTPAEEDARTWIPENEEDDQEAEANAEDDEAEDDEAEESPMTREERSGTVIWVRLVVRIPRLDGPEFDEWYNKTDSEFVKDFTMRFVNDSHPLVINQTLHIAERKRLLYDISFRPLKAAAKKAKLGHRYPLFRRGKCRRRIHKQLVFDREQKVAEILERQQRAEEDARDLDNQEAETIAEDDETVEMVEDEA